MKFRVEKNPWIAKTQARSKGSNYNQATEQGYACRVPCSVPSVLPHTLQRRCSRTQGTPVTLLTRQVLVSQQWLLKAASSSHRSTSSSTLASTSGFLEISYTVNAAVEAVVSVAINGIMQAGSQEL
eukprot:327253-Pelagomonas_calceolata.AAC.3